MDTITLQHVLDWMDAGQPFSIVFVTADKRQDTGGEWIEIPKAWKHDTATRKEKEAIANTQPVTKVRRNPQHYANSTRNIRLLNGDIRKVHIRLITLFNSKTVL